MRMQDMLTLQDQFAQAFRDARVRQKSGGATPSHVPPVDISEAASSYRIDCDLPGAGREDIRVVAKDGAINISGVRRMPQGGVSRSERRLGSFARVVPLPSDAELGDTSASFRDGVLSIQVGRRAPSPVGPVRIEISE